MVLGEDRQLAALVSALRVVAAGPHEQVRALDELRAIAEEIARGDEPVTLLDRELSRRGVLPAEAAALVVRIDEGFDAMVESGGAELFTERGIRQRREWEELRALARRALTVLGA